MSNIGHLTTRRTVFLVVLTAFVSLFISGCSGTAEVTDPKELKTLYKEEFGLAPAEGVKVLGFKFVGVGDSEVRFYRFEATPEVVDSLVSKGFVPCSKISFSVQTEIKDASPAWWRPADDKLTSFYYAENWDKHGTSGSSHAWLGVNSAKTMVYVFVGISF